MPLGIDVDWGLAGQGAQAVGDIAQSGYTGALQGLELGQKQAVLQAERSANMSSPTGITSALNGLVHAGALDQAGALSQLQLQTMLRQRIGPMMGSLPGMGGSPVASAPSSAPAPTPQAAPAAAPGPAAQPGPADTSDLTPAAAAGAGGAGGGAITSAPLPNPNAQEVAADDLASQTGKPAAAQAVTDANAQAQMAHRQQTMQLAVQATQTLQGTQPDQRQAVFEEHVAPQLLQRGVPPQAVQAAGADLSDEGLAAKQAYYQAHLDQHPAFGGTAPAQGQAGIGEAPVGTQAWAREFISNPQNYQTLAMLKAAGIDMTPMGEAALRLNEPEVQQEALDAHQPAREALTAYAKESATNPLETTTVNVNGRDMLVTKEQARELATQFPGMIGGLTPEQQAAESTAGNLESTARLGAAASAAATGGSVSATNAGTLIDVPVTDPGSGVTRTVKMTTADYINGKRNGTLKGGVGVTPTNQQNVTTAADAQALGQTRAKVADPNNVTSIQARIDSGTKALGMLNGLKTNDLTPVAQQAAGFLNTLGVKAGAKDANNLAMYSQATNNAVLGYTHDFPSRFTDRDMQLVHQVTPTLTTPTDAAKFAFATQLAAANRERSYAQAVTNYSGSSQRELDQSFTNGPGRGSLFADPAFQHLQINGRPAVQIKPKPYRDGHTYGVLFPGTPQASTFLVR